MLSIMNDIDSCLLFSLCVLYEIQNQIYQHPPYPATWSLVFIVPIDLWILGPRSKFLSSILDLLWFIFRGCLVHNFKHMFLVFKQYYTHFHTLFTHTYFHTCFQTTKHIFLSACTKHPLSIFNNPLTLQDNYYYYYFFIFSGWEQDNLTS